MRPFRWTAPPAWAGCALGLAGVAAITAVIQAIDGRANVVSMVAVYQLLVLVVSGAFGAWAGIATGLVSVLVVNWFFLPPIHTFTISDSRNWVSLGVFAATALITSQLAAGSRRQRQEAEARRRDADLLEGLARSALADIGSERHAEGVAAAAARALGVQWCRIALDADEAHPGTEALSASPLGFTVPLVAHRQPLGLLEVGPPLPDQEPRWTRPGFAAAVGGLVSLAVERSRLVREALDAESLRRSGELKTALLRTVSHELRTPLTAVRTAGEALAHDRHAADADALLAVISGETERLEHLVANLLDLSRLEADAVVARLDWCDAGELVAGAVDAAAPLLDGHPVRTHADPGVPLVRADAAFCERILVNLLHNAVRHGAPPFAVEVRVAADAVELEVSDGGTGPDARLRAQLFTPFVSGARGGGTGIGLALSRGLAEAQGGSLRLEPGGPPTRFVLSLPLVPVPEVLEG
jgi:two-component system sensor histidine kinase KdpD